MVTALVILLFLLLVAAGLRWGAEQRPGFTEHDALDGRSRWAVR